MCRSQQNTIYQSKQYKYTPSSAHSPFHLLTPATQQIYSHSSQSRTSVWTMAEGGILLHVLHHDLRYVLSYLSPNLSTSHLLGAI
jgi:hypothetical protein